MQLTANQRSRRQPGQVGDRDEPWLGLSPKVTEDMFGRGQDIPQARRHYGMASLTVRRSDSRLRFVQCVYPAVV
ncbi:MAG TPA: hypothetical protein VF516_21530, partial [Kofleriaceae bacterium]